MSADKTPDPIARPSHYNQGSIQPIMVIRDWRLGFCLGNAVKYICRAPHKDSQVEDLKKAVQDLQLEIEELENARKAATLAEIPAAPPLAALPPVQEKRERRPRANRPAPAKQNQCVDCGQPSKKERCQKHASSHSAALRKAAKNDTSALVPNPVAPAVVTPMPVITAEPYLLTKKQTDHDLPVARSKGIHNRVANAQGWFHIAYVDDGMYRTLEPVTNPELKENEQFVETCHRTGGMWYSGDHLIGRAPQGAAVREKAAVNA
jgi:hypothetical protein